MKSGTGANTTSTVSYRYKMTQINYGIWQHVTRLMITRVPHSASSVFKFLLFFMDLICSVCIILFSVILSSINNLSLFHSLCVCVCVNSVLEVLERDACRPDCTWELCQANPNAICSARWLLVKHTIINLHQLLRSVTIIIKLF